MAWQGTPAVADECVLAAPAQVYSLAAAVKGTTAAIEGVVPGLEFFPGVSLLSIGGKNAGLDRVPGGAEPANALPWSGMFERGFGIDVQFVLRRPARASVSLATGDTFMVVRGTLETYNGKEYDFGTPDTMVLYGGWLEGRTLLSKLDASGRVRPYLQYGGGIMRYGEVVVNGTHWDPTIALGWRTGLGLEFRGSRLGVYVEGGIQVVGAPDVVADLVSDSDEAAMRTAQDLVTYPIRFGAMLGF
jgi:hypothetical protein